MKKNQPGGFRRVGHLLYARVRYGNKRRLEVRVPWATTEAQVEERATIIRSIAERLVRAHRNDLVKRIAKQLANATTQNELSVIEKAVTQLC